LGYGTSPNNNGNFIGASLFSKRCLLNNRCADEVKAFADAVQNSTALGMLGMLFSMAWVGHIIPIISSASARSTEALVNHCEQFS
jgi:hypothetical protein